MIDKFQMRCKDCIYLIEDENGRLVGWQDEYGSIHTPRSIAEEISGCLIFLVVVAGFIAGCSMRVREEIQKRRDKDLNKPQVQKVENATLLLKQQQSAGRK